MPRDDERRPEWWGPRTPEIQRSAELAHKATRRPQIIHDHPYSDEHCCTIRCTIIETFAIGATGRLETADGKNLLT